MPAKLTTEEQLSFAVTCAMAFGSKPDMADVAKIIGISESVAESRWRQMKKDFETRGDVKNDDEDAGDGSAKGASSSEAKKLKRKSGDLVDIDLKSEDNASNASKATYHATPPPRKRGRPSKATLAARALADAEHEAEVEAARVAMAAEASQTEEDKKVASTGGNNDPSEEAVAESAHGLQEQVADWLAGGYVPGSVTGAAKFDPEDPDL